MMSLVFSEATFQAQYQDLVAGVNKCWCPELRLFWDLYTGIVYWTFLMYLLPVCPWIVWLIVGVVLHCGLLLRAFLSGLWKNRYHYRISSEILRMIMYLNCKSLTHGRAPFHNQAMFIVPCLLHSSGSGLSYIMHSTWRNVCSFNLHLKVTHLVCDTFTSSPTAPRMWVTLDFHGKIVSIWIQLSPH